MRQELRLVHIAGEQSHINLTRIKNVDTGIIRNMIIPGTIHIQAIIEEGDHLQDRGIRIPIRVTHMPIIPVCIVHTIILACTVHPIILVLVTLFLIIPAHAVHTPVVQEVRSHFLLQVFSFWLLYFL